MADTTRGCIPGVVQRVCADSLHVVLGWSVPPPTGLPILRYCFLYNAVGSVEVAEKYLMCDNSETCATSVTLNDLTIFTTYNVSLQLENAKGWSDIKGNVTVQTTSGSPPRKIGYLQRGRDLYRAQVHDYPRAVDSSHWRTV